MDTCVFIFECMYRTVKKKKALLWCTYIHTLMSTQYCARHWQKGKSSQEKSRVKTVMELLFLGRGTNRKTAISRGFE